MSDYLPRIVDFELDELVGSLPAISLEGPRAVGKTETALRRAATIYRLDDPRHLEIISADPERVVAGEQPVLVDEWQRLPTTWDTVRRAVDRDPAAGQFLLTGSAAPARVPTHTGAGRIVTVRMRPMSLAERGLAAPTVRLAELQGGRRGPIRGAAGVGLAGYTEEIVRSGFPAIRRYVGRSLRAQLDGYLERITEREVHQQGRSVRDRASLRRWMTAYAAATSTATSFTMIRDAASAGENYKPAKSTTIAYRAALEGLWMVEETPAWIPTRNLLRRLAASPVHQLADPALAARLLGVGVDRLIEGRGGYCELPRDGTLLGALFESLVSLSVRVYAQANESRVSHLRTRGGEHEIDLIVERDDGRVVALEVKLSATVTGKDVRHLRWLAERIGPDLLDAGVITTGPEAYRRSDGIAVIPAALLTA